MGQLFDGSRVGDVEAGRSGRVADPCRRRTGRVPVDVGGDDERPFGGESGGQGGPDAAAGTGHDGDAISKSSIAGCLRRPVVRDSSHHVGALSMMFEILE